MRSFADKCAGCSGYSPVYRLLAKKCPGDRCGTGRPKNRISFSLPVIIILRHIVVESACCWVPADWK